MGIENYITQGFFVSAPRYFSENFFWVSSSRSHVSDQISYILRFSIHWYALWSTGKQNWDPYVAVIYYLLFKSCVS